MTKPIPDGYHSLTPHLVLSDAAKALEFYTKAFGAEERFRMPGPDGKSIGHAEIQIGDSIVMICQANAEMPASHSNLYLYVKDVDKVVAQAVKAGAKSEMPVTDMFWGDRFGVVADPFGQKWEVATHTRDLTPQQIAEGAKAFFEHGCGK